MMRCCQNPEDRAKRATGRIRRYEAKARAKAGAGFWRNPEGRGMASACLCCAAGKYPDIRFTARRGMHPAMQPSHIQFLLK